MLQEHNICRQRYHGGAFIGNHVHHALQPGVIAALTAAPLAVVTDEQRAAPQATIAQATAVTQRCSSLLKQFANCRRYSSCARMSAEDIQCLEEDITDFMKSARQEVVCRKLGNVTPKLLLLEAHLTDSVAQFRVGLGLLAEQGGESIHTEFNDLMARHGGIINKQRGSTPNNCESPLVSNAP